MNLVRGCLRNLEATNKASEDSSESSPGASASSSAPCGTSSLTSLYLEAITHALAGYTTFLVKERCRFCVAMGSGERVRYYDKDAGERVEMLPVACARWMCRAGCGGLAPRDYNVATDVHFRVVGDSRFGASSRVTRSHVQQ